MLIQKMIDNDKSYKERNWSTVYEADVIQWKITETPSHKYIKF